MSSEFGPAPFYLTGGARPSDTPVQFADRGNGVNDLRSVPTPRHTTGGPADAIVALAKEQGLAAADLTLDPSIKARLDELTYVYRLGDAVR